MIESGESRDPPLLFINTLFMSESTDTSSATQGNLNNLATLPVGRLLWQYSLPAVVGMLVMSLYNVVDRIFIGQGVGADAITGLTLTFPVMNITVALGVLIGAGASARISIMLGAKDLRGAHLVLGNALTLMLIIIGIYLPVFAIYMTDILQMFGADAGSMPYAYTYMMWMLPGIALSNITFTFNNLMRASGYPQRAMFTMIIGAVLNVALDPLFIFVLDMGISGAAIASDIAMLVSAIFVMWHFTRPDSTVHFRSGIYKLRKRILKGIVSIGAAPSLVNFASCAINIIINLTLASYGGNLAIAAAGIFSTYASLICLTIIGICQGMQPVAGYNYGAKLHHRVSKSLWLTTIVASVLTVIGSLGGMFAAPLIARAFTDDITLIDVTASALPVAMSVFFVVGFQIVATNFFMAIGHAMVSIFLSLSRQVIFLIPLLIILPRYYGLKGIWLSFPASDVIATLVTAYFVMRFMRRNRRLNNGA